ncbi:MAG: tetratricopeptide repeat protein [Actinomycetota bacterium]
MEHKHNNTAYRRVSKRDRVIMTLLTIGLAIVALRPFVAFQSFNRAYSFSENQMYNKAITHYRRAILLDPKFSTAHSYLAYCYNKTEQIEQAIASYQRAIELNPKDKQAHLELGLIHYNQKEYTKAIIHLDQVAKIDPQDVSTRVLLAECHERIGQKEKAYSVWKEILTITPIMIPPRGPWKDLKDRRMGRIRKE